MRALLLVVALAGVAHAGTRRVVILAEPDRVEPLQSALQITLGGGTLVMAEGPPPGPLRLERAGAVQRVALQDGADAGVWVEEDAATLEVCVVSADGKYFRHAPLPADMQPRVFAAIATSLLDELLAPPEAGNINVNVHVDVSQGGVAVAPAPTMVAIAPPAMPVVAPYPPVDRTVSPPSALIVSTPDPRPPLWDRTLIELGPMITPLSVGLEGEIAFPVSPSTRLGVMGSANKPFDSHYDLLYSVGGEIRHINDGIGSRHFVVGAVGGAATADGDTVGYGGARIGMTWQGDSSGFDLSFVPLLLFTGDSSDPIVPGAWVSARWELPL